ncbi:MAG TPA: DUF3105 domain-containing protein [Oryzihumus sp.]|nr:DUF3105 domain-containing protein [Oryzihumus sp.]
MAKKQVSQERKARLAEIQRQQNARERRTKMVIIAGCLALLLVLAGVITFAVVDAQGKQPDAALAKLGVAAGAASCSAITTDAASGNGQHVGPGTNQPNMTTVKYATVPPSFGEHFAQPDLDGIHFYTGSDTPKVETLVHNLEHGYTVLWYDPKAPAAKIAVVKQIAEMAPKTSWAKDKFIAAPWDSSHGTFPAGKLFALSHWAAKVKADGSIESQAGHRQLCGDISGDVVKQFIEKFPRTDAPEPNAA